MFLIFVYLVLYIRYGGAKRNRVSRIFVFTLRYFVAVFRVLYQICLGQAVRSFAGLCVFFAAFRFGISSIISNTAGPSKIWFRGFTCFLWYFAVLFSVAYTRYGRAKRNRVSRISLPTLRHFGARERE